MKKLLIPLCFLCWTYISCGSDPQTQQTETGALEVAEELDSITVEIEASIKGLKDQTDDVKAAVDDLLEEE